MSVKSLIIKAPKLCKAKNHRKHEKVASIVWQAEEGKKEFAREEGESPEDRIGFLFDWECEDTSKRDYCKRLATLAVASHYAIEHGDVDAMAEVKALQDDISKEEASYPDIAQELSVADAARGFWF